MRQRVGRALSLAEVLVVTGLLVLLGLLLVQIYGQGLRATTHLDSATSAYRNSFTAMEQIKRQMRGARLRDPVVGTSAAATHFGVPTLSRSVMSVDSRAQVIWSSPQSIDKNGAGDVIWHSAEGDRVLGHLGPQGELSFRRAYDKLLEVQLVAYSTDARGSGSYTLKFSLFLPNQI